MNREGQEKGAKRGKWDESGRRVLMRLPVLKSFKERDRSNDEIESSQNSKKFNFLLVVSGRYLLWKGFFPTEYTYFSLIRKPR